MKFKFLLSLLALTLLSGAVPVGAKPKPPACVPLSLVGGQGNEVNKTVSPPTIPAGPLGMLGVNITNNDWNTDWSLSGQGKPFKTFLIRAESEDTNPFQIRAYLKYSDNTHDEVFNNASFTFTPSQPLEIKATPRPNQQPYQVNLFVAGVNALGQSYSASVVGCY
ncbi:MAG: hypothetical protein VKN60_05840 [Cyanobacteriota bacterium]|nr:hypothetical protein [Cyanobacteriota bacterium]